mmetsp:Transcript_19781/g.66516  ORF Transcript_19781/g.66516 Transcript_19781/m.66516 type:complete len:246 (+) Transcript_19781:438-1175(+)
MGVEGHHTHGCQVLGSVVHRWASNPAAPGPLKAGNESTAFGGPWAASGHEEVRVGVAGDHGHGAAPAGHLALVHRGAERPARAWTPGGRGRWVERQPRRHSDAKFARAPGLRDPGLGGDDGPRVEAREVVRRPVGPGLEHLGPPVDGAREGIGEPALHHRRLQPPLARTRGHPHRVEGRLEAHVDALGVLPRGLNERVPDGQRERRPARLLGHQSHQRLPRARARGRGRNCTVRAQAAAGAEEQG